MSSGFVVRANQYHDSVFLMGVSKRISDFPGVTSNAVLMATESNKAVLSDIGISDPKIDAAAPGDLIAAVTAESQQTVDQVLADLDTYLAGGVQASSGANPRSIEDGLRLLPNANLVVISVPGEYAARETTRALEAGRNVFLFSDNVSVEDEVRVKKLASAKGLVVMGPDCGTALIGGVGVGFANVVRRGPIGAIAASGTGLQEFTCLVHNMGSGISHGIGTGGRDLSDAVGGITTLAALDALESDPGTKVIALISKPPGEQTLRRITDRLASCAKPVVACFLGTSAGTDETNPRFLRASTLDAAATAALTLAGESGGTGGTGGTSVEMSPDTGPQSVADLSPGWNGEQKYLRGVFAGGTFCYQSQQVLAAANIPVRSNAPLGHEWKLQDPDLSIEHTIVDMGADEYTSGRPHPMIDGTLRNRRILRESDDSGIAILLLDFVLGHNSSMDPAGDLIDAIVEARERARRRNGELVVVASICGTDLDPQSRSRQTEILQEAGVIVFNSNLRATSFCAGLIR